MRAHAILSASSAHRWLNCTPSARLEESFSEKSSVFAEEGTAAHVLSEHKLKKFLGGESKRPKSRFDSEEMEYYSDAYVDFATELIEEARERCKDPIILLEQRLDYSCFVPEGFGTGDLVIVADKILEVVDLKFGKGIAISAENNAQMKLYALGALELFDSLYDIEAVRMSICQPRLESISSWEIKAEELLAWGREELVPKAKRAFEGKGDFYPGEHCRFCKARFSCRARAEENLELAKHDFRKPALLSDDEIAEVLLIADRLSKWAGDVYAYATDLSIRKGKQWKGFKLVEGRGRRKYTDEKEAVKVLSNAGYTDIYKQTLIGITGMEKLLGKKDFEKVLKGLVERSPGKPTLVPETDKRKEMSTDSSAENDFKEEI